MKSEETVNKVGMCILYAVGNDDRWGANLLC